MGMLLALALLLPPAASSSSCSSAAGGVVRLSENYDKSLPPPKIERDGEVRRRAIFASL